MKKQDIESLRKLDTKKLQSEADKVRTELAGVQLEVAMDREKDTNKVSKLKKKLAVILTLMQESKVVEKQSSKVAKLQK